MHRIATALMLLCLLLLSACDKGPQQPRELQYSTTQTSDATRVYRLAIHPLHNPRKLSQAYQPLVDHLNQNLQGVRIELESSRDYQAYEAKFRAREPELILPNPWQTLEAMKVGYHVIAMAGDAADFKGVFIVRKDRGIRSPADLKGKMVSYPSQTALAGCIMPQYYLHTQGVDVNRDIDNVYVGSQESSIMNVYLGKTAAGATWPPPWRLFQKDHPREAEQLELIWETPSLMNNSFMVRDDLPAATRERLGQLLQGLEQTAAGRAILANMETARFYPADDASYEMVREYIARFEREVRPVESK